MHIHIHIHTHTHTHTYTHTQIYIYIYRYKYIYIHTYTPMCVLWTLQGLSFLYGLVGTSELQSYSFKIYMIIRASRKKMNEQMLQKLSLL